MSGTGDDESDDEKGAPAGTPPVEIPIDQVAPETLDRLLAEVVLRDDTDYGDRPRDVASRVALARAALARGELVLVYDFVTCSAAIVPAALRPRDG